MQRPVRAVVYGVGAMGCAATKMMLEKGVDIVGAVARSDEKVGKDLAEVAGLDIETKVTIERDAASVLSARSADIAILPIASYMDDMFEHLKLCAENGINAITISEEALYPWRTSPAQTAELDRIARANGVTITGSGHQDVYWVNLVSMVMGTAHRIASVHGKASWNVDDYGPEVAQDAHIGDSAEEFDRYLREEGWPPGFSRNAIEAIVADVGLTVATIREETKPILAEEPTRSKALEIEIQPGEVAGFAEIATLGTQEGTELTFEMIGRIYREGEADSNEWVIRGEPDELHLSNPRVPTAVTTCTQFVNRIPDVLNAPPGFVTVERLPKLRYRAFPLHLYVNG